MKRSIFLTIILLSGVSLFAQTAIGSFRSHIAVNKFISVAVDASTIYAATDNGLMLLDKSTIYDEKPDISSWSKADGLSDIGIVKIFHDDHSNSLIICYNNGNIDIIRDDKLVNVEDVKNKSLSGSKRVQSCRSIDGLLYLVYPFGIVIFDTDNLMVLDTWFTKRLGVSFTPTDIAVAGQRIYVSTTEGVFSIQRNSPVINDFAQWQKENDWDVSLLAGMDDKLFAIKVSEEVENAEDTLFVLSDGSWNNTGRTYQYTRSLSVSHDSLLVCNWNIVELLNADVERLFYTYWYSNNSYPDAREAVLDGDNIWVADHAFGLVQNNMPYFSHHFFQASGPYQDYVEKVVSHNGIVAAVHGSRKASSAYSPAFSHPAVSWFQDQEWQFNSYDFLSYDTTRMTYDLNGIAINPKNESEWALASWTNGIFICLDHRPVAHYNEVNSILEQSMGDRVPVSGLQYDKKGNLWLTNSSSSKMLKMMEPDGTWHAYNITNGVVSASSEGIVAEHLLIDSRGYKWVNFPRDGVRYHLIAFTDNGTYDNLGDDKLARIDMNAAAEVQSSTVYCMAEDLDGEIWIGTDKGVKVIYYPSKVFDGNVYPRNILLEQDGYVSVLLEFEEVTAIAVDGANRKWIGTSKAGVFLMSENGQEQLLHFTAEDNPLFSNQIVDINVNQYTGEVFFSTAKGLVSYKGTSTAGFKTYEELPVYPNPVPHGYSGAVAVNGLKANSLCKITDSAGNLVWQGYSDGGQLVWYCKDHYGNRPATGVYYVMASDEDGNEKIVTKFLFIN